MRNDLAADRRLRDIEAEAPCARCRRIVPADAMRLWITRERVRKLARSSASIPRTEAPVAELLGLGDRPRARFPAPERRSRVEAEPPAVAPGGRVVRYEAATRVDAVCAACHQRLRRGGVVDGPSRRRMWLTLGLFLALAAAIAAAVPAFMPNLLAAFWRNGAGGG